jgi:hypothetical protein
MRLFGRIGANNDKPHEARTTATCFSQTYGSKPAVCVWSNRRLKVCPKHSGEKFYAQKNEYKAKK